MSLRMALTALIILAGGLTAVAEVPQIISYQGRLTDASGDPVADDLYIMEFLIYGSEAGSDLLWSSYEQKVDVAGGLFEYQLGSNTPFPKGLFTSAGERYLTVVVGTEPEGTPRVRLVANPYALQAVNADTAIVATVATVAADLNCTQCVGTSQLENNAVTGSKVDNGSLSSLDLLDNAGVATSYRSSCDLYDTQVTAIDSVGISVPASGYVLITVNGMVQMRPSASSLKLGNARFLVYQFVPASLPLIDAVVGYSNEVQTTSSYQWQNVSFTKTYSVSGAGDYWYYFLGDQGFDSGSVEIRYARLTAVYVPASYGITESTVMDPSGFDMSRQVTYTDETSPDRPTVTDHVVDLRELEIEALRKRLEAEEAESELLKARLESVGD